MVRKEPSRSSLNRGFRMGKLGLSLTGSYIGYQMQNLFLRGEAKEANRKKFNQRASHQVREELQSLKGAVMKIGQMLSMQTQALPPEVTEELANLQMKAPAMHASLARAQFKASCGKFPGEVYREFAPEPFAAASLGQVHGAVTKKGERVAVKIQYPAIRTAIENDFKLLRSATLPGKLTGYLPKGALEEMEAGILRETDYVAEAKNQVFFREKLRLLAYVNVPVPLTELSTDRVLTMTHLEGVSLEEWLRAKPTQAERDELGRRLGELFHYQLRRVHALHSDPHPGNYLFRRDGTIGLVDFGSVSHFSPRMIEMIQCFSDRAWERGEEERARMTRLICGPKTDVASPKVRKTIQQTIEFYNLVFPGGVVDFGQTKLLTSLTTLWKQFLGQKVVNPELIFSSRAELGLYNLLHRLAARVDTTAILNKVSKMKP